jgi:hypothetical protein
VAREQRSPDNNPGVALVEELRVHSLDGFAPRLSAAFGMPGQVPDVLGWFVDVADVATVFVVSQKLLVRAQIASDGRWQVSTIPASRVRRIDELWDGQVLTAVVEFDADAVTVATVTSDTPAGRETVGTFTSNGYLIQAGGALTSQLASFITGVRRAVSS